MKVINGLITIGLLVTLALIFYPKVSNYIDIKTIEKENEETIQLIDKEDIITKEEPLKDIEDINTEPVKELEEITEEVEIIEEPEEPEEPEEIEEVVEAETQSSPLEAYLQVDFICQAPLQTETNWTLHEESCEEAAVLQAYLYETDGAMTKAEANTEILNMISWQNANMGGHLDLYADELKEFVLPYYDIDENELSIVYDAEIEDIKEIISNGHPVIVPVTSQYLNNPYYPHPGYHMLIVTGYTADRVITNDNGTRRGEDFSYSNEDFEKAMKDSGADILYFTLND